MALSFPVKFFRSWMLWPQIMSSESNRSAFARYWPTITWPSRRMN